MKEQTYPCMANVGNAQCKNRTKTADYRCSQHKNVTQSGAGAKSLIPSVAGALQSPVLKPKAPTNFDESFLLKSMDFVSSLRKKKTKDILKDRYIKRSKDPTDYSGAASPGSFADKTFECITTGLLIDSPWMTAVGIISSAFAAGTLFAAARYKHGMINVENSPSLRKYDLMLPDPEIKFNGVIPTLELVDYGEAMKVERRKVEEDAKKRIVRIRNEKTKRIVEEHWRRLEEKARDARASFINVNESGIPTGHRNAANLYEDFREQFYVIGASPDPISAALQRADEIEAYPQEDGMMLVPHPPFLISGISEEERIAAKDIVSELRSMAEALNLQSAVKPLA